MLASLYGLSGVQTLFHFPWIRHQTPPLLPSHKPLPAIKLHRSTSPLPSLVPDKSYHPCIPLRLLRSTTTNSTIGVHPNSVPPLSYPHSDRYLADQSPLPLNAAAICAPSSTAKLDQNLICMHVSSTLPLLLLQG